MSAIAEGHRIGPYRIVRLLGEGGMGVVYEAVREDLGGRVALKVLRGEYASKPEFAARFFNEARAANVIEHPGVARVFDYAQLPSGVAYLAMEYLDGESLAQRLERLRKFTTEETVRVGRQIASAVAAAHAKKIIHRDLKPENIMLVPDLDSLGGDRAKILDFGIAKLATEHYGSARTQTNVLIGTPIYMAPEQCRGTKGVGEKTDVYALGVVLYEMLAGQPPFVADEPGEYIGMHMFKEPPPLQQFAPNVPTSLLALVHAMLLKVSEQRPDMAHVAQELKRIGQVPSESLPVFRAPQPKLEEAAGDLTIPFVKSPSSNENPSPKPFDYRALLPQVHPGKPTATGGGLPGLASSAVAAVTAPGAPALASLDELTKGDEPRTQLSVFGADILTPPTKLLLTPERRTAQTGGQPPPWLRWVKDRVAKGAAFFRSGADFIAQWVTGLSANPSSTMVMWNRKSAPRRLLIVAGLGAAALGLLITLLAFKSSPPKAGPPPVTAALASAPPPVPPPVPPPTENPTRPVQAPTPGGSGPSARAANSRKWTATDTKHAIEVAHAKADRGNVLGALETVRPAAELGNDRRAWAMVGTYYCRLRNPAKASDALSKLATHEPGVAELRASVIAACESRGFVIGRDG